MRPICVSLPLLFVAGFCYEASAATIMGSVSDNAGNFLAGAQVNLNPTPSVGRGAPGATAALPANAASATATAAGQFEFDNIAPGSYSLCVVPNNRTHVNYCAAPGPGNTPVTVSASDTFIHTDLPAVAGVPILLTVVLASSSAKLPAHVFLDSPDGSFFPMENDAQAGHFWVVAPPLTNLRVVTHAAGGQFGLPAEVVNAGAAGVPVEVTVIR